MKIEDLKKIVDASSITAEVTRKKVLPVLIEIAEAAISSVSEFDDDDWDVIFEDEITVLLKAIAKFESL